MNPQPQRKTSPSLRLFRPFITRDPVTGALDVSRITSRECYENWMRVKGVQESDEHAKKFFRTVTNHISGTDGRCPFDEDEERAILVMLRRKEPWQCFPAHLAHFGQRYRAKGFHERHRGNHLAATTATAAATAATATDVEEDGSGTASSSANQSPFGSPTPTPPPPPHLYAAFAPPPPLLPLPLPPPPPPTQLQINIHNVLSLLPPADAEYLGVFCPGLLSELNPDYPIEARAHMCEVVRFTILGRTSRVSHDTPVHAAHALSARYTQEHPHRPVWVFDLTSKLHGERIVALNPAACDLLGDLTVANLERLALPQDIPGVLLAVLASYFRAGVTFTLHNQELHDLQGRVRWFNMRYCVDWECYILAIQGEEIFK